jgi:hypothetical protein
MSNQEHGAPLERNLLLFMAINMLLLWEQERQRGILAGIQQPNP